MIKLLLLLLIWQATAQFTPITIPQSSVDASGSGDAEIMFMEGKRADPCNRFLTKLSNCDSLPDSSVTVLVPSETSDRAVKVVDDLFTGAYQFTIVGRRFQKWDNAATTVQNIGLGSLTTGCDAVTNIVTFTRQVGQAAEALRTKLFPEEPKFLDDNAVLDTITFSAPIASGWYALARELETQPRPLCISNAGQTTAQLTPVVYKYTGFKIGVVWNCDIIGGASTCTKLPPNGKFDTRGLQSLTNQNVQDRAVRLQCCKNMNYTLSNYAGATRLNIGQCIFGDQINPLAPQRCCGSAAFKTVDAICCNEQKQITGWVNVPCICNAADQTCPAGQSCCLFTKYAEFNGVQNPTAALAAQKLKLNAYGECFNPNTHKCCDTGMRYDPGAQQCCPINGVQSLNVPCPCGADANCPTGLRCCAQVNGTLNEIPSCSKYSNYPTGSGPYQSQRCTGTCFDPTYQLCCNGIQCIMAYEKCCNNTCCNRFTQTCTFGRRTPSSRYNYNEFNVLYHQCTTIQQMQPVKIAFPIVFPVFFLVISFFCTAIALIFANKASSRSYATIEKAMIYVAVLTNLVSCILYFSLAWKYGLTIAIVQCFVILTASCRVKSLNVWCLFLSAVLALYLVDPFHGNSYLNFASSRSAGVFPDRDSAGLIHVIGKMFGGDSGNTFGATLLCKIFYLTYFTRDNALRDLARYDNPQISTFGYCDRAYILNLLVWCSVTYVLVLLQLLLVLLGLLLRFTKSQVKVVVHEDE